MISEQTIKYWIDIISGMNKEEFKEFYLQIRWTNHMAWENDEIFKATKEKHNFFKIVLTDQELSDEYERKKLRTA